MSFQEAILHREPLVFSTVTKSGKPHSNVMLSLGMVDEKILIGLCFLNTTFENLQANNSVCLITCGDKGYFRIKGKVEMFKTGKYFDLAISLSKPPLPKMAVLVSIDEVFDLSAGNIVELN